MILLRLEDRRYIRFLARIKRFFKVTTITRSVSRNYRLKSLMQKTKSSVFNQGLMLVNKHLLGRMVLREGQTLHSPGGTFAYQIVGPCCRLFDREQLPWPSCSISWRGKQPSWRRVGRRFVLDAGTKSHPTYAVRLLGQDSRAESMLLTLFWVDLSTVEKVWWHGQKPGKTLENAKRKLPNREQDIVRLAM